MPFIEKEGQVEWINPTVEDVKNTEKEIVKSLYGSDNVRVVGDGEKWRRDEEPRDDRPLFVGVNSSINSALGNIVDAGGVQPVDIILPVYGSAHIVSKCIDSVVDRTYWPYNLIVVDDASDEPTRDYLRQRSRHFPDNFKVLFNNKNRGFAATVNRGIKESGSPYICFLNSDVLVTPHWLTKMVMALESNSRNQIVNPITNNTALINVDMQEGYSYLDMNRAFEKTSQHRYPEIMPTGFCFLFRRELVHKIGLLDEAYKNYGEESDYWMRAITYLENGYYMKYRAVLADDTYLFHERGSSFGAMGEFAHLNLRKTSNERFHRIWPQYSHWIRGHNPNRVMAPFRKEFPKKIVANRDAEYKICWVVRSTAMCGGMKYITDVTNEINEKGGDAKIALVLRQENTPVMTLPELRCAPIVFKSDKDFVQNFSKRVFEKGVVISAISEISYLVDKLREANPGLIAVNHVQSYDPAIAPDENTKAMAYKSYEILPHNIANSNEIKRKLEVDHKVSCMAAVHPGVDRMLFYPRGRDKGDDRPTILISLNRSYPFKGFQRGVELAAELWRLAAENKIDIRVMAYGVEVVPQAPFIICHGGVSQVRLASLLGTEVDIFVDPSSYHSYGLPALEAMASGVPVVSWDNEGIREFGVPNQNCLIYQHDQPVKDVANGIFTLLGDTDKRQKLATYALEKTVPNHDRIKSVAQTTSTLETELGLSYPKRRIVFITPHMRKHGGPTTIIRAANELSKRGHNVSITCVYTDINPEITLQSKVPIHVDVNQIPPCDVMFVNSDNPDSKFFSSLSQVKNKILWKLSHNPRFQVLEDAGLKAPWDKIITTSDWLVDACMHPKTEEGWTHGPRQAERVGWFHYGHGNFQCHPSAREYGSKNTTFILSTLIHQHPLKGTKEVVEVLDRIRRKYRIECIGVGEIPPEKVKLPNWLTYVFSPDRQKMAEVFKQTDVWIGGSHTEGLGRMALEAMSAGAACVLSDTKAEFTKHNENCILYPIGDAAAMEEGIETLLKNPEVFKTICLNGFETAESFSDPTEFVQNLERIIYELCQK